MIEAETFAKRAKIERPSDARLGREAAEAESGSETMTPKARHKCVTPMRLKP